MYIGVTERGDPSLDFSWVNKLYDVNIIITKCLTDKLIKKVIENKERVILHITCTGMGGTKIEPNVYDYLKTYEQTKKLINEGFPVEQIVLRIDPIVPNKQGLKIVKKVLDLFIDTGIKRVRYSFLNMYNHVKVRLKNAGFKLPYTSFHAPDRMIDNTLKLFSKYEDVYKFESCAENTKHKLGCISEKDLEILGVKMDIKQGGYQRKGCMCLGNKRELLSSRKRCGNFCLYCFWKD